MCSMPLSSLQWLCLAAAPDEAPSTSAAKLASARKTILLIFPPNPCLRSIGAICAGRGTYRGIVTGRGQKHYNVMTVETFLSAAAITRDQASVRWVAASGMEAVRMKRSTKSRAKPHSGNRCVTPRRRQPHPPIFLAVADVHSCGLYAGTVYRLSY